MLNPNSPNSNPNLALISIHPRRPKYCQHYQVSVFLFKVLIPYLYPTLVSEHTFACRFLTVNVKNLHIVALKNLSIELNVYFIPALNMYRLFGTQQVHHC